MARRQPASKPGWADVKAELARFDRPGLVALHSGSLRCPQGQSEAFFTPVLDWARTFWSPIRKPSIDGSGRMSSGTRIRLSLKPNRRSPVTRKAIGDPTGLAELMVFYCECAAGFCNDVRYQDDSYFNALVRMFEQALKTIAQLSASDRNPLIARLHKVVAISHRFGYGVGDDMDSLFARYGRRTPTEDSL